MAKSRISRIADAAVPNTFPARADEMLNELMKHGLSREQAQHRIIQCLLDALNGIIAPDPQRGAANEFVVVVASNTDLDPQTKLTHTCGVTSTRATDHAKAYGIISALAQYVGTKLIIEHVNKDDVQRALTDFYREIEVHVGALREHERQGGGGSDEVSKS